MRTLGGVVVAFLVALAGATAARAATWSVVPVATAPAGAQSSSLGAVSCASLSACTAVGGYTDAQGNYQFAADRWDGSTFSVESIPSPPDASTGGFTSVSCPTTKACMAVGYVAPTDETADAFSEGWDGGSWGLIPVPLPAGESYGALDSVSCASLTDCVAVGGGLIEQWNGSGWTAQALGVDGELNGVSCPSTTSCTAVGEALVSNPAGYLGLSDVALVEQLHGTTWSGQELPLTAGAQSDTLNGVSCPAAGVCVAGGVSSFPTSNPINYAVSPLVALGNGTNWSKSNDLGLTLTPTTDLVNPALISCPSVTSCSATGGDSGGPSPSFTVLQASPSGVTDDIAPPLPGGDTASPSGLSCPAPSACVLVGTSELGNRPTSGLIEVSAPPASPLARTLAAR